MSVLRINGTFTCSIPHTLASTSPIQISLRLHQIPTTRKVPHRLPGPRHLSVVFLQSMTYHPRLTRNDERTLRTKKTKLNSFFLPNCLNGDLNDHVPNPDGPLMGNLRQRFSPNLHWSPSRNSRTQIWKTWQGCLPLLTRNRRRPRSAKVCAVH